MARLDSAILAVSIVSLAEVRAGRLFAGWSAKRSADQEARLAAFLQLPFDSAVLDEYVKLHAWSLRGNAIQQNDLWIAATAVARSMPLASCDKGFDRIASDNPLTHIYLPPTP